MSSALDVPAMSASASAATLAARRAVRVFDEITDVNPCTGELVTITCTGTGQVHDGGDNVLLQARRTVARERP